MNTRIELISPKDFTLLLPLAQQIYPTMETSELVSRIEKMFSYANYLCWGFWKDDTLLGVCGAWITERIYCGKQLEIDNFIVDAQHRSEGVGAELLQHIENYALEIHCKTIELNSYVHAGQSHKFYFRNGYTVLGFHFEKKLQ